MNPAPLAIGVSSGLALSFAVVAFAVVGLGPWFTWVPDVVLLLAVAAVAVIDLAQAGFRAGSVSGSAREGASAAALAGAIAGLAAGTCYVVFGKGAVNLVALPIVGALAGMAVGGIAAFARR